MSPQTSATDAFPLSVLMIESPGSHDLYEDRIEGRILSEVLRLATVPHKYRLATNKDIFGRALGDGVVGLLKDCRVPIVHISAHGDQDGIHLTDGSVLEWAELGRGFRLINNALGGGLLLCLSCCSGAHGGRMAMREDQPIPFYALVGHAGSPTWSDATVAFVAFYHRLLSGETVEIAVAAMQVASGNNGFILQYGQHLQQSWTKHIQQIGAAEPLRRAAEIIEAARQQAEQGTQK